MSLQRFALDGRVALVTGASRGIGAAIAEGLADASASVIGVGRSAHSSPAFEYRQCDVGNDDAVAEVLQAIRAKHGRLDILINAAGVSLPVGTPNAAAVSAFEAIVAINLGGTFRCCTAAFPLLAESGRGSVINITSLGSVRGFPGNPGYAAAKGGVAALTRALAVDWGRDRIRVNAIAPGYVRTAMTEGSFSDPKRRAQRTRHTILGRWGELDEIVGTAIYLASDASSYVTGQELFVDGGWTVLGLTALDD